MRYFTQQRQPRDTDILELDGDQFKKPSRVQFSLSPECKASSIVSLLFRSDEFHEILLYSFIDNIIHIIEVIPPVLLVVNKSS